MRKALLVGAAVLLITATPEAICVATITRLPFEWIRGSATIAGRVVDINGRPLRGAEVSIARFDADVDPTSTTTRGDGGFRFVNLPATRYILSARKQLYIPNLYGADGPSAQGRPIDVHEASSTNDITIVLRPAGAVEGRVTDEYGDPVFEARVTLARRPQDVWQVTSRMVETNDKGWFRVPDVMPGAYVLCVEAPWNRQPSANDTAPGGRNATTVYTIDCYGGPAFENARSFEVRSGDTVRDMDVALRPVRVWKVSGAAFDSRGRPLVQRQIFARQWNGNPYANQPHATTDELGRFVLNGLPPGDYVLSAEDTTRPKRRIESGSGGCRDQMMIVSDQSAAVVRVGEGNVEGVVLAPTDVVPLSGRVFFDDDRTPRPQWLRVELMNVGGAWQGIAPRDPAAVSADGSFSIRAEPTLVVVDVRVGDSPWFTKAVRFNGVDVTGKPIDFSNGVGGLLEIELTTQPSEVTGRGLGADGKPAFGRVVAVSRNPQLRSIEQFQASDEVRIHQTFSLKGLLPGDYYLVGLHDLSIVDVHDLDDLASRGTLITVKAGERTTADVRLELLP